MSLTGFQLKWIAVISIVLDHIGSIVIDGVIAPYRNGDLIYFTADMPFLVRNSYIIKSFLDAFGRIAFPIFCFLIVEGFIYTRNQLRYGLLLGIFALISEISYDIAHYQKLLDFSLQNVMFTLCIGVFTLYGIRFAWKKKRAIAIILTILFIVLGCGISLLIRSEYVFLGVSAMSFVYLLRNKKWRVIGLVPLIIASPYVIIAFLILLLYNGERGKGSKYFFYIFYPLHFLVLAGIAYLLATRQI